MFKKKFSHMNYRYTAECGSPTSFLVYRREKKQKNTRMKNVDLFLKSKIHKKSLVNVYIWIFFLISDKSCWVRGNNFKCSKYRLTKKMFHLGKNKSKSEPIKNQKDNSAYFNTHANNKRSSHSSNFHLNTNLNQNYESTKLKY